MLEEGVEDVETEAVDAAQQPEVGHIEHGRPHVRTPPIQVGLLGQEGMQVELVTARLPGPGRAAEEVTQPFGGCGLPDDVL